MTTPSGRLGHATPEKRMDSNDRSRSSSSVNPQRRPRTRLVVQLNSKPRHYLPGTGPPLQRPRLLPAQDSTAYIVDRILLPSPGLAASSGRPLPKRMTYIVGWRDLPAARALVPAMRVLDYVSPYVLEEWEYKLEQELEGERAKLKEASRIEAEQIKAAKAATTIKNEASSRISDTSNGHKSKKRNRNSEKASGGSNDNVVNPKKRKRKARPPVHSQIEAGAVVDLQTEAQAAAPPAKGVMSLSTPQKARLDEFEGLSEVPSEEDDMTPSRQVEEEMLASQRKQRQFAASQPLPAPVVKPAPRATPPAQNRQYAASAPPSQPSPTFHRQTPLPSLRPEPPGRSDELTYSLTSSFTPIVSSRRTAPLISSKSRPEESQWSSPRDTPTQEKPKKRRKKTKEADGDKTPAVAEGDGEPVWEVKRLEDMRWYDVEGRGLVKYFLVRWEGDWPPDQNPSWEPEENLPPTLVRNYLKNPRRSSAKQHRQQTGPPAAKQPPKRKRDGAALPWGTLGRKYSSVSEAFADEDVLGLEATGVKDERFNGLLGGGANGYVGNEDNDDRFGQDELFVVEDQV